LIRSGRSLVLVDHVAEDPSSPYRRIDREGHARIVVQCMRGKALVWTVPIEMGDIFVEERAGVPLVVDQYPVGALLPDAADEPFHVAVRLRGAWRDLDHVDAFGGEQVVEALGEFRVPVTDQ
jgi:hypothetical protein